MRKLDAMDFFDPKKKKLRTIKLFVGYGLIAVALLASTVIVWSQTYGFDIDRKTGDIIQKGLVFVDANPESATIYLNGEGKGQTGSRFTPAAGHYLLELKRSGYRSWKHDFDLYGGTIERFVYPFLFPEKMVTAEKQTYAAVPSLVSESPDRRWLIVQQPANINNFDVFDLTNPSAKQTTLSLPADTLTASTVAGRIEAVEWSSDNRHLLLKRTYSSTEYILLDRESPTNSVNVTKVFGLTTAEFMLRDKKPDQFYVYTASGGVLQTADLKSRTVLPLLSRIVAYRSSSSSVLVYVTDAGASAGKVLVRVRDGDKDYTLKELPTGSKYLLELMKFNGHWYVAAGAASEGKVSIYLDPIATLRKSVDAVAKPISTLKVDQPSGVSFSTNKRFIMAQGGSNFAVYDAERDRQNRFDTGFNTSQTGVAKWMDGHRIAVVSGGKAQVFDFDGTNMQSLSVADLAFSVFFDKDYTAFYTIAPSKTAGQTALTRTELIVK